MLLALLPPVGAENSFQEVVDGEGTLPALKFGGEQKQSLCVQNVLIFAHLRSWPFGGYSPRASRASVLKNPVTVFSLFVLQECSRNEF